MIVIKLGGSLCASGKLAACLDKIEHDYKGKTTVIVPGGGLFAEQVRRVQQRMHFDDRTAHQMALLAMQQMALLYRALKPRFTRVDSINAFAYPDNRNKIAVWFPDITELDQAGIPSSWAITSDSLSAWLAGLLDAETLTIVKSVTIDDNFDVLKLIDLEIVDASFYTFIHRASFKLNIVNAEIFLS